MRAFTWTAALASAAGMINNGAWAVRPVVAGEPIVMSPSGGTYPRANFLQDGSLLGAVASTSDGTKTLLLLSSDDNGQSWSARGSAASRPVAESDLDNPYPLQLPGGRILLAYRNHDKTDGDYTYYRMTISYSDDNGASWLYLSTPAQEPAGPHGLWEPFLRNAQDGSLQIYYSKLNGDNDQDSILRVSSDGGVTWGDEQVISGTDVTARDGMLGVTTLPGGSHTELIAVFESLPVDGVFSIHAITSPDDGKTWGDRRLVYSAAGENNNAGAPQVVNVGGVLCVSFMTDEDTQLHHWTDGAGAKILVSTDGVNFSEKTAVFEPEAFWPGMVALNDSALLYMADRGGAKAQTVLLQ